MKTTKDTKPSPYLIEVLAAEMFMQTHDPGTRNWDSVGKEWRSNPETRVEFRNDALRVIANLEAKGVKIVPARPQLMERSAKELAIVPASVAYVLEDDGTQ